MNITIKCHYQMPRSLLYVNIIVVYQGYCYTYCYVNQVHRHNIIVIWKCLNFDDSGQKGKSTQNPYNQ